MRVLIAEDDRISRRLLENTLQKWGYEVVVASDGDEAWARLQEPDAPQLLVLDWMMPGLSGPEICSKLREENHSRAFYALLLTAKGEKSDLVVGLESGADDYITKPFDRAELRARVRVGARLMELQSKLATHMRDLKEANEKLFRLSSLDGLTGVPNRRCFDTQLDKEWRRAMRLEAPLSLIMMDVDFFKLYNDRFGHLGGDECLIQVAKALSSAVRREGDMVARYGGEEFVAILPNTDGPGAMLLAERMRANVEALDIPHPASSVGRVSISLGVSTASPNHHNQTVCSALIKQADRALYMAKESGRNRALASDESD